MRTVIALAASLICASDATAWSTRNSNRLPPEVVDMPTLRWRVAQAGPCDEILTIEPYRGQHVQRLAARRREGGIVHCTGGAVFFVTLQRADRLLPGGLWRDSIVDMSVARLR